MVQKSVQIVDVISYRVEKSDFSKAFEDLFTYLELIFRVSLFLAFTKQRVRVLILDDILLSVELYHRNQVLLSNLVTHWQMLYTQALSKFWIEVPV